MTSVQTLKRLFPFLTWARPHNTTLLHDLVAGASVSLLAIPQALAYAQLAGVPTYIGLYAALIPSIVGVLFGSSAILSTGPVAMTSLLTAASVGLLAAPGSDQFVAYVTLLALISGLIQIALGLARAGVFLNLLSHPVLMGFINAAALIIAFSQLPSIMGISAPQTDHFLIDTWNVISRIYSLHVMSVAFGSASIFLLYAFRRFAPKLPGVLISIGLATWCSYRFDFSLAGGNVVGAIPAGFPEISLPALSWKTIVALTPAAFVIALISFMEATSSCKIIAIKTRSRWNENQELIGQGLAKVAAAFCQSMPVSGSFSRSALNLASGARTGFSSLVAAAFVLLTLLYLTPLLYHLPKPALAAMIIIAVANLVDIAAMRNAWRTSWDDGMASAITFVATLAFAPHIENGLLIGICFSIGAFVYRRMSPRVVVLAQYPDGVLRDVERHGLQSSHPEISVLRFDASLFFGNAALFEDTVLKIESKNPHLRFILIVANGINHIDATAVEMLRGLAKRLREIGITLAVSGAKRQILRVMDETGLTEEIGMNNIFRLDKVALDTLIERLNDTSPCPATPTDRRIELHANNH